MTSGCRAVAATATAALAISLSACASGSTAQAPSGTAAPLATGSTRAGLSSFCTAAKNYQADQVAIHRAERPSSRGGTGQASVALQAARDSESALASMAALAPGNLKPIVGAVNTLWKPFFDSLIQARGDMGKVSASLEQGLMTKSNKALFRPLTNYEISACHFRPSDL